MKAILKIGGVFLAVALIQGCSFSNSLGYIPESNFSFPNSNVVPMSNVKGSVSSVGIGFVPPGVSGSMINEAISKAKSQVAGADTVLNVQGTSTVTQIPLILIPVSIYKTSVSVEGIAAKMTVGKQKLN